MIIIKDLIIYNEFKNKILVHIEELSIPHQSILILKADSGKGKSILLKTLANEYTHFAGNILFNNKIFESYTDSSFSATVQFLSQSYPLFLNMTVFEQLFNVLLHIKREEELAIADKIKITLTKLNLWAQRDKYPYQLSGGQRQRIALIQKILLAPKYLLLDEPTSGLDKTSKFEVLHFLLEENRKGMTLIIASHDQEAIHFFEDKIVYTF
jgi:polar amino acid transport system ATP-binding protein